MYAARFLLRKGAHFCVVKHKNFFGVHACDVQNIVYLCEKEF